MFKHQVDFKNGHFAKLKKVLHLECKLHQTRLCVALKYSEIHLKIGEKDKLYYKCHLFTRATYSKVVHDPKIFRKNASRSAVAQLSLEFGLLSNLYTVKLFNVMLVLGYMTVT